MVTTLLAIAVVLAVGSGATGRLRTAALESVLSRLPEDEARAYYERLRRAQRRVALMRVLALVSLLCLFFVFRQRLIAPARAPGGRGPATSSPGRASSGSSPSAPAPPR